jgi:hypothetical protein
MGVIGTALRVEPHIAAILNDLEAEAVPFGFVQPIFALGLDLPSENYTVTAYFETLCGTNSRCRDAPL